MGANLEEGLEDVLGWSDENLGKDDGEEVVQLRDLDETLGQFTQVAHVDAAVVDGVGQRGPVHRRRAGGVGKIANMRTNTTSGKMGWAFS